MGGYLAFGIVKLVGYSMFAAFIVHLYRSKERKFMFAPTGQIAEDFPCQQCHYNLRTLRPSTVCPECGMSVDGSLKLAAQQTKALPNHFIVGLARTILGMAIGLLFMFEIGPHLPSVGGRIGTLPYQLLFLFPIRVVEWSLIIWLFFDRGLQNLSAYSRSLIGGVLMSYALDIPAAMRFCVAVGGIC